MSKYKRILLKVSGEGMMGDDKGSIHNGKAILNICKQIKGIYSQGIEICLVIGGGNILRGGSDAYKDIDRSTADYMGMLATVINSIALQSALEGMGVESRVQSAIRMNTICEPYVRRRAMRHLEQGRVVLFASGTGNPFFTTDTASVLRAIEMNCEVILKGTQVDGVYSADPLKDKNAIRYDKLSYQEVIEQNLQVMDGTAFTLARDNNLPIMVFSAEKENGLADSLAHKGKFTIIS